MNNVGTASPDDRVVSKIPENHQPTRVGASLFEWTVTILVFVFLIGFFIGEPIYRLVLKG